jgi:hypothetical protein
MSLQVSTWSLDHFISNFPSVTSFCTFFLSEPMLYALSVRDFDQNKQLWVVRHYKIRPLDGHRGYFIAAKKKFASFDELIAHYSSKYSKHVILFGLQFQVLLHHMYYR